MKPLIRPASALHISMPSSRGAPPPGARPGQAGRRMGAHKRSAVEEGSGGEGEGGSPPHGGNAEAEPLSKKARKRAAAEGGLLGNVNKVVGIAAKYDDPRGALAAYEGAVAKGGAPIMRGTYLTLFHLATGGAAWEDVVRGRPRTPVEVGQSSDEAVAAYTPLAPFSREEHLAAADTIYALIRQKVPLDSEQVYTCRCRLAMLQGDAAESLAVAREAAEKGSAKIRTFTPALLGFCLAGQMDHAFEVKAAMEAHDLCLTESEFAWMLEGSLVAKCFQTAYRVIHCMKEELVLLEAPTLQLLRAVFESEEAKAHFAEAGRLAGRGYAAWQVTSDTAVEEDGVCEAAGGQLRVIDLTPEEMSKFAEGIRSVVHQRGKTAEFEQFIKWLEANPREIMLDGANIALFGQNFENGGWSFEQIERVMERVEQREPGRKLLVVLHVRRINTPDARRSGSPGAALLERLKGSKQLHVCPKGANDDWYWLYAAVKAGERGLLVSNDEMRDHIFSLLAPKYFLRWKQHHQIKFNVSANHCVLHYPPKYTRCIQELDNGALVFPYAADDGETWLVAKPT
mmetsp:Transcript_43989/g.111271  ORF Transcript_43989/g.111271 Transcript_43989/m.111271 type:complete len:568 (-) Transcript_43989:19-1722(-)